MRRRIGVGVSYFIGVRRLAREANHSSNWDDAIHNSAKSVHLSSSVFVCDIGHGMRHAEEKMREERR